ncbi:MAG: hypothetical protein ABJB74_02770, partial [Gemmatimonas sp.]
NDSLISSLMRRGRIRSRMLGPVMLRLGMDAGELAAPAVAFPARMQGATPAELRRVNVLFQRSANH